MCGADRPCPAIAAAPTLSSPWGGTPAPQESPSHPWLGFLPRSSSPGMDRPIGGTTSSRPGPLSPEAGADSRPGQGQPALPSPPRPARPGSPARRVPPAPHPRQRLPLPGPALTCSGAGCPAGNSAGPAARPKPRSRPPPRRRCGSFPARRGPPGPCGSSSWPERGCPAPPLPALSLSAAVYSRPAHAAVNRDAGPLPGLPGPPARPPPPPRAAAAAPVRLVRKKGTFPYDNLPAAGGFTHLRDLSGDH